MKLKMSVSIEKKAEGEVDANDRFTGGAVVNALKPNVYNVASGNVGFNIRD